MADLLDLSGQRFGRLTVIKKGKNHITSGGHNITTWLCKCDCGNEVQVASQKLRKGHTTSCGCQKKENKGSHFEDLTGKRFNRLTVIRFIPQPERTTRQYDWWCRCDCGNEIKACASKLKSGAQQSCGCLKEEMKPRLGDITRKYKYSNKRLYSVYQAMITRCTDSTSKRYKQYGERGIKVCKEWLDNYDCFAEWALNNGYDVNAEHGECTIDRINVNGDYEPSNCRWISNQKQQCNRSNNVFLEYRGKRQTMKEWANELGISYSTLRQGIRYKGKTIEYYINTYKPHKTK